MTCTPTGPRLSPPPNNNVPNYPTNTPGQQSQPASSPSEPPPSKPHPHDLSSSQRPPSWINDLRPLSSDALTPTEIAKAAIEAELDKLPAKSACYAKNLATGEEIRIRDDHVMNSLSLIKLAVVLQAYKAVEAGELNLNQPYTIMENDLCWGTGQFTRDHVGTPWTLGKLLELIMILSDNTANDIILGIVGLSNVNKLLADCGYKDTSLESMSRGIFRKFWTLVDPKNALLSDAEIYAKGFPAQGEMDELTAKLEADPDCWVGKITARDVGQMIEDIYFGKHVSKEHSEQILNFMYRQHYDSRLPTGLSPGMKIAHKTGDFPPYAGHDAGLIVIDAKRAPIVVVVLTGQNKGDFSKLEAAEGLIAKHLIKNWG